MSIAVYVPNDCDTINLIQWAIELARAAHEPLQIVLPSKTKSKTRWEELAPPSDESGKRHQLIYETLVNQRRDEIVLKSKIAAGEEGTDHDRTVISIFSWQAPSPSTAFADKLPELGVDLLVLPTFTPVRGGSVDDRGPAELLFNAAQCSVVSIGGGHFGSKPAQPIGNGEKMARKLLLVCENDQDDDDDFALDKTAQLARSTGAAVTVLYVRPPDDVVARDVADRHLKNLAKTFQADKLKPEKVVALAETLVDGINQLDLRQYDLILAGTRSKKTIRRLVNNANRDVDGRKVAVSVLKNGTPMTEKFWGQFKYWVRGIVPQIDRERRVALVDRLNSSSKFDFDFFALISLSTLIAALGLARDSGAVVIGAMLVAPLMTPLVAIGLALVQGNQRLIKDGVTSVLLGFAVAVMIGVLVGAMILLGDAEFLISSQMRARGWPNMLDLIVALASGVAAAYAMGRPHLVSALPGVAIAAALVPPIATAGLSLPMGDWLLAGGASLLFFTNVIAIVLGTAVTFWAVGISTYVHENADQAYVRLWPRYCFLAFVLLSCLLAAEMAYFNPAESESSNTEQPGSNTQAIVDDLQK